MKKVNKSFKILSTIMLVVLVTAFILLRIDNNIIKIIGIFLVLVAIIVGFIIISKERL